MRQFWKLPLAVVCLLALAFLPLLPAPRGSAQSATYTATDTSTPGGAQTIGYGIDGCGKVVGEFVTGLTSHNPFFWNNGTFTDLGTFGGSSGTASGVNNGGTVAGSAQSGTSETRPFIWTSAGGKIDIGGTGAAAAYDINETNQVVGQWEISPLQDRAFVWTQATGRQIITATWGTPIAAYGINNAGDIVGTAETSTGAAHAFIRTGGVTNEIGTLGGSNSFAYEVNDNASGVVVVGYSNTPSSGASRPFHAFRWSAATGIQDLGTLGGTRSIAYGVNSSGQVVGYSEVAGGAQHAFLWSDDNLSGAPDAGEMKDLNSIAPVAGWTFEEARGINDRGQIVATAVDGSGLRHAFLLTPDNAGPSPCAIPGSLQFSSATYTVGEAGTTATITVTRTGGSDGAVSVGYATSNGTATAGSDYTATSGTLNFADGDTEESFSVTVSDDALDEPDETVNLTLSSPSGGAALGAQTTATLTITDNDAAPTLSINDVVVTPEGNAGTVNATFAVTLSAASGKTITVNYATADNSAVAPGDYTAIASTQLTFNPGETSKNVNVAVAGDTTDEANETFFVNLSGATNATINDGQGVGTINDDDGAPSLSIDNVTVTEGNAGTTNATFTVSLLPASGQAVSVGYATADGTATTAGNDYAAASGTLNFGVGETSKTITVNVNGDTTPEANETFFVNLSSPSNATISDNQGLGTINNDDTALTINDVTAAEGNSGSATFTFNVGLSHASANAVSVNYATSDGTATAGSDYAAANGTLNFAAGETSKTVSVTVNGDTTFEAGETFNVTLSGASGATVSDGTGVGTITNDDTAPSFSIGDVIVTEGNSGTTAATFTVSLSAPSGVAASVNYATADGPAPVANAGSDYTAASGTLNFTPGDTSETFTVAVTGDTNFENDETFSVNLTSASGATISDAQALGTITNDEASSTFQFSAPTYTVGESGTTATITVTRSPATAGGATVHYAASNGSALADSDFTATNGTLTFAAGDASEEFTIAINNDALDEPDETVSLALSAPFGGTIGAQSVATLTIQDNDDPPALSITDAVLNEGNTGTTAFSFNVTLSAPSGRPVSVDYATLSGPDTATAGTDYTAKNGTLNFAAGEQTKTVTVSVNGDRIFENDETFLVNLSNATNATISDAQGVGTITNDEEVSSVEFTSASYTVGEAGPTVAVTVRRTFGTAGGVTVNAFTENGTAVVTPSGSGDYVSNSVTLTFAENETEKTFNVAIVNDTLDESDETFSVKLSNSFNRFGTSLGTQNTATVTITDDDPPPSLSVGDVTVTEGDGGTTNAVFNVTLTPASAKTVTVNYATANGTANVVTDYTAVGLETLTFSPGETSKSVTVAVHGDTLDEANETFFLNLTSPTNATIADAQGQGTILNDDGAPSISIDDVILWEGNFGTVNATFNVSLTNASGQEVTVNYAAADGTAVRPFDFAATAGTLNFAQGELTKSVTVTVVGDTTNEPDETFFVNLSGATNATIFDAQGQGTILNDDRPTLSFAQATYPASEGAHFVTVTVTRTGDTTIPVTVDLATSDGTATERKDYTAASGTLRFAAGETSKGFVVLLTDDSFQEPEERLNVTLSNPTGGATLGGSSLTAGVLIAADDDPPPAFNTIDVSSNFVRQHYHDFLNREPDAAGLAFWTGEIEQCGSDAGCREVKRINVSAAFFLSIEFQETGYLVYRTFKAAYGDATSQGVPGTVPVVRLNEFLPDTRRIGEGVVVGPDGWQLLLEANKQAYMLEFVQRQRFTNAFPLTQTPAQFVDALFSNAGVTPTTAERQAAVDEFGGAATSADAAARARALRRVAEHPTLVQAELRRAFVLMQYYGYLRRNPDDAPEPNLNFGGWAFWLGKLNEFNGNFVQAEMVKAFLDASEYRNRFGQ